METGTSEKSLQELVAEQVAGGDLELPVFNPVALKLQQALNDEDITIERIEAMIMEDQALSSQILRMANAAFYKGLSEITTINRAIIRLGAQQVANLAMVIAQKQLLDKCDSRFAEYGEKLWQHALASATGCRWLAQRCGFMGQAEMAFLAGLMHDIGKLVVLMVMENILASGRGPKLSEDTVLEIINSTMHNEHGYTLMQSWNLPEQYCLIARDHHQERPDPADSLMLIVRLTDQACRKLGIGTCGQHEVELGALEEAHMLGLTEIQLAEFEIHLEDSLGLAGSI